ncbi:Pycsar system effector family protein [Mucilaginibacter paludis]|uniref:Metal-dependent phosphohydrolase HD region n=1 Tax=Mucilaginibacter paludis DSM 18603 TaxID=714943 RepID=H1YB86_9SPHI|nr:Pycsar system effector family protein [Mucilaginibacter paludis]EHQ30612.1 metal-dependent phosphohydrolase HD region [Mucilaginibacter paludis DSM 18603]
MNYQQLIQQAQDYVLNYYRTHNTDNLAYHNLQHTEDVIAAATQIANHYQLNDQDFAIVLTAVWFHDLGYVENAAVHEEVGATLAETFLKDNNADDDFIQQVKGCIMATKMPQSPTTLIQQIVCDADLFHLGLDDFFEKDKLVLKEFNILHQTDISKQDWRKKTIDFLEKHNYHTEYCKVLLNDGQAQNLAKIKSKVAEKEEKSAKKSVQVAVVNNQEEVPVEQTKKDKKKSKPEKGIETMFRISSSNHQRLSNMADNKAHIMITVNSIILSAIISLVLRRLNEYGYLIIPTFILLAVSVLAMTFAILSTRPSIPSGVFNKADIDNKSVNLLFFGNFYKMPLDDYNYGMRKMMEDEDFLYGSLIKDVYSQGVVLGKKYRLLRISYNVFMFGLIFSVAAFIIASTFFSHHPAV